MFMGKTITLANDINIGATKITSITKFTKSFFGTFDRQGHKIIGFNDPANGLFRSVTGSAIKKP